MSKRTSCVAAMTAIGIISLASAALAQTTVTSFAPFSETPPAGVWYQADVRTGGAASVVDLTGVGGNLETAQPLAIGAAKLTTDLTNAAKAEVAVADNYGVLNDILSTLQVGFDWHKVTTALPASQVAAPSIKLTFVNPVCDDLASLNDCFITLVWEAYQDRHAPSPPTDTWTREDLDHDTGRWWVTGGFGAPNGAGGCGLVPCPTLDTWLTTLSSDFGEANLVAVSVGVGTYNQGQIGYFDNVTIAGTDADASYDFEPPTPCTATCYVDTATGNDANSGDTAATAKKTIQAALNQVDAGGTVIVAPGTYAESPDISASVSLQSTGGSAVTIIDLQTGPTYLGSLTIGGAGSDVAIEGFTIEGRDADCPTTLAASNIFLEGGPDEVNIVDNVIKVGAAGACTNYDDGFGLVTTYDVDAVNVTALTVEGNTFEPLTAAGTRAFYINPGVNAFYFTDNEVTGQFSRTAITQAMAGLVEDNTIDGQGSGGSGLGTWGYPDADLFGNTTFRGNLFVDLGTALNIFETNDVVIEENDLTDSTAGVAVSDGYGAANFDPTTVSIHQNNITGNTAAGVDNQAVTPGTVDATCNWWGAVTGPGGPGDDALGDVDSQPWLVALAPGGACLGGSWTFQGFFQPVDNDNLNKAKAGQTIPVKWQLLNGSTPVSDPASFVSLTSRKVNCLSLASESLDEIENYTNASGLLYQGDGNWQFNWKTPNSYAGQCRVMTVLLADGTQHSAEFAFK